jgi:hypothetical protein
MHTLLIVNLDASNHPAIYSTGIEESFPRGEYGRMVKLTDHFH